MWTLSANNPLDATEGQGCFHHMISGLSPYSHHLVLHKAFALPSLALKIPFPSQNQPFIIHTKVSAKTISATLHPRLFLPAGHAHGGRGSRGRLTLAFTYRLNLLVILLAFISRSLLVLSIEVTSLILVAETAEVSARLLYRMKVGTIV
jgi:hypothetical protein